MLRHLFAPAPAAATIAALALAACVEGQATDTRDFSAERIADGERIVAQCRESQCRKLVLDSADLADFSAIADMDHVEILMVSFTSFDDLSDIAGMTQLKELHVRSSELRDLSGISGFPNLTVLHATGLWGGGGQTEVGRLSRLTELAIDVPDGDGIGYLRDLRNLESLVLSGRDLNSLAPLAGHPSLRKLDLTDITPPADLSPLLDMPRLRAVSFFQDGDREAVIEALRAKGIQVDDIPVVIVC